MKKKLIPLLLLPILVLGQSIIVERVNVPFYDNTLEGQRLALIEKQLGIHRVDFEVTCDRKFSGVAEVIKLPSDEIVLSSKIDGRKEKKYFTSVALTAQESESSLYKANIHFCWFSQNYTKENEGIQTSVTGIRPKSGAFNRFDFPQELESDGTKTVWVFSIVDTGEELSPIYALRIKSDAQGSSSANGITITLTPEKCLMNGEEIEPTVKEIKEALEAFDTSTPVLINADPEMPFKSVSSLVELLKDFGFSEVTMGSAASEAQN